ncbi:ATP-binding protein [Oxalobacteraceae bacterium A2-2]
MQALFKLHDSIAAKLVLGYGLLGTASMAAVSAVFYFGTIGVLDGDIDRKLVAQSERLAQRLDDGMAALAGAVRQQLSDGIDSEREIYLLLDPQGRQVAGNLTRWPALEQGLLSADVTRAGRVIDARLYVRRLPPGGLLVVGRDQEEQQAIRGLVARALAAGAAVSLLLTVAGALLFRRQVEGRLGAIRRTAAQVETGDLSPRVPVSGNDEFALLSGDINRMLDRIERLMDGVRHVSNAIAHDLRTPLSRVRSKLDDALRHSPTVATLGTAAHDAIDDIDDLIRLFERLLQIAEAESGMRPHTFERIDLRRIAADITEMYEASAEDAGVALVLEQGGPVLVDGDRNLLASAVASLLDNALKYAGAGAVVTVRAGAAGAQAWIAVCDNGPGIPAEEMGRVTQRFYRLDQSRHLPGNGLGLAIVGATAVLHGGALALEDGHPGLVARLLLPAWLSNP